MCAQCFPQPIKRFDSWQDFATFETQLQQKVTAAQLTSVPVGPAAASLRQPPENCYTCATCSEVWALSSPDNAWRGYFLPLALVGSDEPQGPQPRGCGCTGLGFAWFLVLLLAIVLWGITHGPPTVKPPLPTLPPHASR